MIIDVIDCLELHDWRSESRFSLEKRVILHHQPLYWVKCSPCFLFDRWSILDSLHGPEIIWNTFYLSLIACRSELTVSALFVSTFSWPGEATAASAELLNFFQPVHMSYKCRVKGKGVKLPCFYRSTINQYAWFLYIYVSVWIPVLRIHEMGSEANESLRRFYTFFGTKCFNGSKRLTSSKEIEVVSQDRIRTMFIPSILAL